MIIHKMSKIWREESERRPLDADKLELLGGSVAVVEEELLAGLDVAVRIDADAVVAVDARHLGKAVGIDRVVGKADLVALALGVHHELVVQIEQVGALEAIVDLAAPVGLVLADDLAAVLGNELVAEGALLEEDAPAGDLAGREQQVLAHAALYGHIGTAAERRRLARHRLGQEAARATRAAQVRIALAHRQVARTMLARALRATLAAAEAVDTRRRTAQTVLLAEVAAAHTLAALVAAHARRMRARIVVVAFAQAHVVLVLMIVAMVVLIAVVVFVVVVVARRVLCVTVSGVVVAAALAVVLVVAVDLIVDVGVGVALPLLFHLLVLLVQLLLLLLHFALVLAVVGRLFVQLARQEVSLNGRADLFLLGSCRCRCRCRCRLV